MEVNDGKTHVRTCVSHEKSEFNPTIDENQSKRVLQSQTNIGIFSHFETCKILPAFCAMAELVGIEVVNLHGKRWKLEDVTC